MLNPGQRIGPFQIVSLLGRGGMGEVFLATDTRLDRKVAIKFLPVAAAPAPEHLARFEQEAKALAAVNHPNLLVIHDVGTHDGLPFLVSEFLQGKTVRERIGATPLGLEELVDLGIQIVEGLGAAHSKGIIHRDLKPANVIVTEAGQAKLLDFGLSKLLRTEASADAVTLREQDLVTSPGTVLGTVAYMSPEQALGQELDGRSDLFSLGVVLYEMSTGKLPFQGNTSAAVFDAILNREPVPASQVNPRLPAELERIIGKALEKDRTLRYQTAADLRADLKRLKRDSESGRLKVQNVATREVQKGKAVWFWPSALAVSALCGGLLVALLLRSEARIAGPSVPFTSLPGEERHPALSPDGKQIAFAWNGGQGVNWHLHVKQSGLESPVPRGQEWFTVRPGRRMDWRLPFTGKMNLRAGFIW